MKLREKFKCKGCGSIVDLDKALAPPSADKPAEAMPCACGAKDWEPVK